MEVEEEEEEEEMGVARYVEKERKKERIGGKGVEDEGEGGGSEPRERLGERGRVEKSVLQKQRRWVDGWMDDG